ncbi:MAG: HEAT repeat domain-containing protein [Chloroflexota bacterium]|nr:HEAT repeat domain-containing protein [Chloroflexota bacterium]
MPLFGPPNIGKLIAKGDIKGLIKALGYQKNPAVCQSASSALVQMGSKAIQPLISALKDKDKAIQEGAGDTLVKMGNLAVDRLIKAATARKVDKKAIQVLSRLGDQAVMKAGDQLINRFLKAGEDCQDAASALVEVGPIVVDSLVTILKDTRMDQPCSTKGSMCLMLAYNMEKMPHYNDLLKKLAAHIEKSVRLRALVAGVLGKFGDPRAVDPLIELLKAEDDLTRWVAAGALFSIGEDRAAEALSSELADEDLIVTGTGSVWLLIGDGLTLKPLLTDLAFGNVERKKAAVDALRKLGWNK